MNRNAVPYVCPPCCNEMVETDEGVVPGYYGRLVFSKDIPPFLCVNCDGTLIPANTTMYTIVTDA